MLSAALCSRYMDAQRADEATFFIMAADVGETVRERRLQIGPLLTVEKAPSES